MVAMEYAEAIQDTTFALSQVEDDETTTCCTNCDDNDSDGEGTCLPGSLGKRNYYPKQCVACEETDPTENGCLCYDYSISDDYAWFMPTDEHGKCADGTKPVTNDYMEIFSWVTKWNTEGTKNGGPYSRSPFWFTRLLAAILIRDGVVAGEGNDEIINWSCLCVNPTTGVVTPAALTPD